AELRTMRDRGDFERMSGKEANDARDDLERLERSFAGMAEMKRLPGALFVIDCKKERIAISEANKLGIPIVAIVDTNCDPEQIQLVIPGNDDAIRSCRLIVTAIGEALVEGVQLLGEREKAEQEEEANRAAGARRVAAAAPAAPAPEPVPASAAPEAQPTEELASVA